MIKFTKEDARIARRILYALFAIAAAPAIVFLGFGCSLGAATLFDLIVMAPLWIVFLSWSSSYRWEVAHGVHIQPVYCSIERPIRVKPLNRGQIY